jgi:hypothetical protein
MKWEYKTLLWDARKGVLGGNIDRQGLEDQLNLLGGEGWDLVSASSPNMEGGSTRNLVVILKRPVPTE